MKKPKGKTKQKAGHQRKRRLREAQAEHQLNKTQLVELDQFEQKLAAAHSTPGEVTQREKQRQAALRRAKAARVRGRVVRVVCVCVCVCCACLLAVLLASSLSVRVRISIPSSTSCVSNGVRLAAALP